MFPGAVPARRILVLALTLLASTARGATYYVSTADGDDAQCTGLSEAPYAGGSGQPCPLKTLARVNALFASLAPGDSVLFKRGDTFHGTLAVTRSGAAGLPLTLGAYGAGERPLITGLTTLSSWTDLGGGLWQAACPDCQAALNLVTVDGVNTAMGRTPNFNATDGGFLKFESHSGKTSITDAELAATPSWAGAELVLRAVRWELYRRTILTHVGGTLTFAEVEYEPNDGFGYFFQNDPRTLDQPGEWYFDPAAKTVRMVFGPEGPSAHLVKVATAENLLSLANRSYVAVDALAFEGSNGHALSMENGTSNHVAVTGCSVRLAGGRGITVGWSGTDFLFENNQVRDTACAAFDLGPSFAVVRANEVANVGLLRGMSACLFSGMSVNGDDSVVEHNTLRNIGYNGIHLRGNRSVVRENLIDTFCTVSDDGAGIYTSGNRYAGREISRNIVLNGLGNALGANKSTLYAEGIYLDENAVDVTVSGNTVGTVSSHGLFLHMGHEVTFDGNTTFDAGNSALLFMHNPGYEPLVNVTITHNVLVARAAPQRTLGCRTDTGVFTDFGTADFNVYARPIDDARSLFTDDLSNGWSEDPRSLAEWQALSGQDAHSTGSPVAISDVNDLRLEYNASEAPKTVALGNNYVDLKGTLYPGTITLAAWSSAVLVKSGLNAPPLVEAGPDQTVRLPVDAATFTAVASDPDGSIAGYAWTEISGGAAALSGADTATLGVAGLSEGAYLFEVRVTDNQGATASDTVALVVEPAETSDAAFPADAETADDAAIAADAGIPEDAALADAGALADGAAFAGDAALPADAAAALDAGSPSDAGSTLPDVGSGCGCGASGTAGGSAFPVAVAALALARRRRR